MSTVSPIFSSVFNSALHSFPEHAKKLMGAV